MSLWENRDYKLLMSGQTVNVVGNHITTFALFLVVLNVTNSPSAASFSSGLFVLSMVVLGLPIGRLVDRYSRLVILKISATLGVVGSLLCVFAANGHYPISLFAVSAFLLGGISSAFGTAERAFLKELIPPNLLAKAMAVNQGRYSIGTLIGPPIAGLLISHSAQAPFWVDAASFCWVLACLLLIRFRSSETDSSETLSETPPLRPAWDWLRGQKQLFSIGWYSPLMNFSFAGITTLSLLSLKYASFSSFSLGIYQAAIGLAGLMGAVIAGKLVEKAPAGRLILYSMCLFTVALAVTMVNSTCIILGMVLAGLVLPVFNAPCSGFFVKSVPQEFQGRCTAILSTSAMVTMPIGNALAGVLFEHFGGLTAVAFFALVLILSDLFFIKKGDVKSIRL